VPNCKLGTLAATLRLPHQPSHRALTDVLATGDLLHALLERAGTYGIVGLEELLDLPKMVGHPQGAKLKLTTRLPHRPGVYWFSDAAGHVLYVGKATDLHSRVRSYFSGDTRNKVGRLLRQMDAVHHRVCPGPLTAAVLEGRLIRTWAPPFNVQGKVKRRDHGTAFRDAPPSTIPGTAVGTELARKRSGRRRRTWTADDLACDPVELLTPFAQQVASLSQMQRYEDAARIRDEADRVRHLIVRHRLVESLRRAERTVLMVDGEGTVELNGGLLVETGSLFDDGGHLDPAFAVSADGHQNERIIVAQWLRANPDKVRVLECAGAEGVAMPANRVPRLGELCAAYASVASATPGSAMPEPELAESAPWVAGSSVAGSASGCPPLGDVGTSTSPRSGILSQPTG
jgi:hypothetical protein